MEARIPRSRTSKQIPSGPKATRERWRRSPTAILAHRPVTPSIDDGLAAMRIAEAIVAASDGMSELSFTGTMIRTLLPFTPPNAASLVEAPTPACGPAEALIRIEVSAICGSELHARAGTNPGHEAAGIIQSLLKVATYELGSVSVYLLLQAVGSARLVSAG